jgi:putative membrane protein
MTKPDTPEQRRGRGSVPARVIGKPSANHTAGDGQSRKPGRDDDTDTREVVAMMGYGMAWGAWLGMGLFWLLLLVLLVLLVVRLLPQNDRARTGGALSPEDILDQRFARGEIDEQTYTAQREVLARNRGARR